MESVEEAGLQLIELKFKVVVAISSDYKVSLSSSKIWF